MLEWESSDVLASVDATVWWILHPEPDQTPLTPTPQRGCNP